MYLSYSHSCLVLLSNQMAFCKKINTKCFQTIHFLNNLALFLPTSKERFTLNSHLSLKKNPMRSKNKKKSTMSYEGNDDINCIWCTYDDLQKIGKGSGTLGNKRTRRDHQDCSIIKIGQNGAKSPGDLRRLDVILTLLEDHRLRMV